jgi:hypothetical protein
MNLTMGTLSEEEAFQFILLTVLRQLSSNLESVARKPPQVK